MEQSTKSGDCDSDGGSISWEDFFGSSSDLVPSLLTMYDTLIAERLSTSTTSNTGVDGQFAKKVSNSSIGESAVNPPTLSSSSSSIGSGWGSKNMTKNPPPLSPLTSGTGLNKGSSTTTTTSSTSSVKSNGVEKYFSIKTTTFNNDNNNKTILNGNGNSVTYNNWGKDHEQLNSSKMPKDLQRPLSVNSIVSSTSSSSCSSSSGSSSLGGGSGSGKHVAPRASPEEEELSSIPHVDISDDDDVSSTSISYNNRSTNKKTLNQLTTNTSSGTSNNMESNNRCFSNSAPKDCGEPATTTTTTTTSSSLRGRISFPIQAHQGKPKFYDPNLSYMDRVVMEIVETERVYVNDLKEIISGYLDYWINQPEETLVLDDIKELFSNIEEIHKFNSEFLTRLEVCGLNPVGVARCFVTKNEGFSIYTQYCTNYPRTMSILTEMMRHEQSAKSFRERQASLGQALPLGSYLLKPVQRILKYHLLLQNIVKHYEPGTAGFETIVEALSAMTNIAHHINDMKRRHEHAVRVQEIQSLLYGWQGEDLTTYGELCAEGTFRAYGAKALRHVFLFDKMLLITKKKEDGILCYKTHIMCSNLMLIESVPGEPLSFHVIPFDNPRLQSTLQARNLEQKREWTLQLKRVILENYHAVIPTHARQLVMELGQYRPEENGNVEKVPTKRQHSAPEYLERRKQEKDRRKSESGLKARLRRARKSDTMSPKEGFGRRSRKNSTDRESSRERSESRGDSREREISIDRKMSSASCPPSTATTDKRLVKKLSGWRRKSEPGIYHSGKGGKGVPSSSGLMSPSSSSGHGTSNLTLDSTESIGEEEGEFLEEEEDGLLIASNHLCDQTDGPIQIQSTPINNPSNGKEEERRESIEEIVGQLVMQNREFQRILSKQRLVHLRKALTQYQRRHLHEEESASETETEDSVHHHPRPHLPLKLNGLVVDCKNIPSSSGSQSQGSSSNGIGSSSDMAEMSSENISNLEEGPVDDDNEVILSSKNVQRTVSDPGNKTNLTPRRFMNGPFAHYDPLSLLWSSFRRSENRKQNTGDSSNVIMGGKGKTSIRHTHSFSCSRKEPNHQRQRPTEEEDVMKDPLPLPHGDSGVFPNSFTSDSSSSSEANIPTLPAVWLKQQDEHLATPNNKSGSLPRSFQVGQQHTLPQPTPKSKLDLENPDNVDEHSLFKSRMRDGKHPDRPVTIASDKPSSTDINYDEMEHYMNKFNDQLSSRKTSTSRNHLQQEEIDDLSTELTPMTSIENINSLHPDHKIYRPSKSSIKHMLLSVTHRLSGLKVNMSQASNSSRGNVNFGSYPNISAAASSTNIPSNIAGNNDEGSRKMSNSNSTTTSTTGLKNLNMLPRNYRKALKQKLRNIVREDRAGDSDSENCESVTCSSGSSGFGSVGSCSESNNTTTSNRVGARLAAQSSEQSDYTLSKLLLSSVLNESLNGRPHSVMSVSSTMTTASSTDEKASSGLGESLSGSNSHIPGATGIGDGHLDSSLETLEGAVKSLYRPNRNKAINHRDLYLSYIDQEGEVHSDSDASADSFYERSFEAIESLLESELFPDSAIYSADENNSINSSAGSQYSSSWGLSSGSFQESLDSGSKSPSSMLLQASQLNSISMLAARLSNSRMPSGSSPVPNDNSQSRRSSRLIRSQAILDKLKHLEECSQFQREDLPSPSFEGMKSIQERRKELELWKQGRTSRSGVVGGEDEYETSSQHSTSTINTVIELSPSKSTSFPSSRRCSDTDDSSGGNSPTIIRAISRNSNSSNSTNHLGASTSDPMPKGWVKLLVGKLQGAENATTSPPPAAAPELNASEIN